MIVEGDHVSDQYTFLFGDYRLATATSGRSFYKHTFGGPHERKGASREDCGGRLIHLLHRLDLMDPAIPFTIPGVRWVPFYYCFDLNVSHFGYRLISDDAMETFVSEEAPRTPREQWPAKDYPSKFPKSRINLRVCPYDPAKLEDACHWAAVFGLAKLSRSDRKLAREQMAESLREYGLSAPKTARECDAAFASPFLQGRPGNACLNPKCPRHGKAGKMLPIALVSEEPVKGVSTFGGYDDLLQLVFEMCGKCYSIRATNQCT